MDTIKDVMLDIEYEVNILPKNLGEDGKPKLVYSHIQLHLNK
jgi:hypothetical protein